MIDAKKFQERLGDIVKKSRELAYYKQSIPSEIDNEIIKLLMELIQHDQESLMKIVNEIIMQNTQILGLFAERMASLAVRESNSTHITLGLIALIIYLHTADTRDAILVLSLLYDAAIRIKVDPCEIFKKVELIVGDSDFLNDFLNRNEESKSIEVMGYIESTNEDGFVYKRTW